MKTKSLVFIGFITLVSAHFNIDIHNRNPVFDFNLYEEVLDSEQCRKQIDVIKENTFLFYQFADTGLKLPKGVTVGNFVDLGNYFQCLDLRHEAEDMQIEGKYVIIQVPLNQQLHVPWNIELHGFDPTSLVVDEVTAAKVKEYNIQREKILAATGIFHEGLLRSMPGSQDTNLGFTLAVCVPKPCTTEEFITNLLFNVTAIGFQYTDHSVRLPNDKPWSPADTTAAVIFSVLGVLTVICTCYDVYNKFLRKDGFKPPNPLYTSFSVYTNGRRLMSFSSAPGTLFCLDGIRSLAMAWVVIGHAFGHENYIANPLASLGFMTATSSIWITAAPITVDTFFCLAGLVLVYSTVGKMTGGQLIRNLPLFYLNRLLRLFPILATGVLLQASFFNRMSDGPDWSVVRDQTEFCRTTWWLTLLHVQNYINPMKMCLPHSWYVAIDFHLYIVSPLVLYWVLGKSRKTAWISLAAGLLTVLTAATIYNFINNFASGIIQPSRDDIMDYMLYYYFNTLTRASPFFVGMIFGYILHIYKGKTLNLSWISVALLWTCAATVSTTIFFYPSFVAQLDWDNQWVDNVMNSFMRPAWGAALCWMIVACVHGYGGPVNWFLSLDIWKLPARLSYATFVFHYPLMFVVNSSALAPVYFTVPRFMFKFLAHFTLSFIFAYIATLLIDSPFSTIFKQLLGGGIKKKPYAPDAAPAAAVATKYVEEKNKKSIKENGDFQKETS